jgi:multidrug efflux pump subunit AcrA (membrane-fusion protein)
MTVAFSESDINSIKVGQPATVTMSALSGVQLAAHVTSISPVATTSSGVVSYNATVTLDQTDSRVRPGMSATASIITEQAEGVTVPNQAVTGSGSIGTVNMKQAGKTVTKQVVVGLRGASRTQIIAGVNAGDQLVVTITLPALTSNTATTSSSNGTLGGTTIGSAAARLLGGGGGGGGGFGSLFRQAGGG